jgi:hypothetical protein
MKLNLLLPTSVLLLALPLAASAQTTPPSVDFGPHAGSQEITIGGNGSSNRNLNSSNGGGAVSYGYYNASSFETILRQTISYSNPKGPNGNVWNGETSIAGDWLPVTSGALRPFVGANLGWVYGSDVRSSAAAGLETGLKYYVAPRTFLYAMADYGWLFRHDKAIAARFTTGLWNWGIGMGFNF